MLTTKQRAFLRGLANDIKPVFQIGKGGINDNLIKQLNDALEARELIKVHILQSAMLDTKETCNEIARRTSSNPVIAIGNNFVIYKRSRDKQKIILP